jgi:hypothetical protein
MNGHSCASTNAAHGFRSAAAAGLTTLVLATSGQIQMEIVGSPSGMNL